jgi:4-aminobutyrate aminotransferase-like enzyme
MLGPHPRPQEIHLGLAEKLKQIAPGSLADGSIGFCNSGSASIEFSMQAVRAYSNRSFFVAFAGAFHGISAAALSLTTASANLRRNLPPHVSNVVYVPFPGSPVLGSGDDSDDGSGCIDQLRMIFSTMVDPNQVAAIYTEPIQVHGGILVPPDGFFRKLMKLCRDYGICLVDDEAITGFGRTGKMFGIEHWGVTPDVMCVAKPFAAGLPLAAVLGRRPIMRHYPGGGTFSGSAIAFASASANIDIIRREHLTENADRVGTYMIRRLRELSRSDERIAQVRGRGLLIGVQLRQQNGKPAKRLAQDVMRGCFKRGLLVLTTGVDEDALRITPPLTSTTALADKTVDVIADSLHHS